MTKGEGVKILKKLMASFMNGPLFEFGGFKRHFEILWKFQIQEIFYFWKNVMYMNWSENNLNYFQNDFAGHIFWTCVKSVFQAHWRHNTESKCSIFSSNVEHFIFFIHFEPFQWQHFFHQRNLSSFEQYFSEGSSINHVVKILGIFDPPPLRGHFY